MRKNIVAGNWKMNTTPAEGVELAKAIAEKRGAAAGKAELILCPPFTHLSEIVRVTRGTGIAVGAQNCAAEPKGAYTGEVSAAMLASLGVEYVILGTARNWARRLSSIPRERCGISTLRSTTIRRP